MHNTTDSHCFDDGYADLNLIQSMNSSNKPTQILTTQNIVIKPVVCSKGHFPGYETNQQSTQPTTL